MRLIVIITAISFFLQYGIAMSDDSLVKKQSVCTSLTNQCSAALSVQDWDNLERISYRYISACEDIATDENISNAYESIAIALCEKGQYNDCLKAADSGLNIKYDEPGLHFMKARAFMMLKKYPESRDSLNKAEKIAQRRIESTRYELSLNPDGVNSFVLKSRLGKYESLLRAVNAMKQ
jgi:hypothetical protein